MDLPARLRAKNLTFTSLAEEVGADRVHLTAALMGQHPLPADLAAKVADRLDLDADELQAIPTRGSFASLPPADPTIARLYEVLQVYGPTIKALIHEDHGDGIMSAINFKLDVQSDERNGAPRVRIVLDGKFLPYAWE